MAESSRVPPKTASKTQRLVSRRAVSGRYRLAVQAQVDAELCAMMDDVVEENLAVGHETRSFEDRLALKRQLPRLAPPAVRHAFERTAHLRRAFVEHADKLPCGLERQRRVAALREIKPRLGQDSEPEARQLGDVRRKSSERHGFGMRDEISLTARDALQHRARFLHFLVELWKEQISDWHRSSKNVL